MSEFVDVLLQQGGPNTPVAGLGPSPPASAALEHCDDPAVAAVPGAPSGTAMHACYQSEAVTPPSHLDRAQVRRLTAGLKHRALPSQ